MTTYLDYSAVFGTPHMQHRNTCKRVDTTVSWNFEQGTVYPDEAGLPIEPSTEESYVYIQVHYNNVDLTGDWRFVIVIENLRE